LEPFGRSQKNVARMLDIESKVVTVYQYSEVILGKIKR